MKNLLRALIAGAAILAAAVAAPSLASTAPGSLTGSPPDQLQAAYSAVISADVASTVALPDGRVLWLAGDAATINGQPVWDPHNEFVVQPAPGSASFTVLRTAGGQWQQVPNWDDGTVFWMAAGAVDNGLLHVFGARVSLGSGGWDITVVGYYDATFSLPDLAYQGIEQVPAGVSAVAQGSGGWWLIGTDRVPGTCYSDCYTAHAVWASADHLGDYASWTSPYTFLHASTDIGGVVDLVRTSSGGWTAWSKSGDILGSTVERLNAPRVEAGPWSVTAIWPVPDQLSGGITYGVRVHPGEGEAPGTDLVTVIENDSAAYGPQFLAEPDR